MIDLFTKQEKIFISFLIFAIIVGAAIKIYKSYFSTVPQPVPSADISETERHIQKRAAVIDSLLEVRSLIDRKAKLAGNKLVQTSGDAAHPINEKVLVIEINSATVTELMQLPQIGPVIASRIVEYRNTYGAFKDIDELIEVKGIGTKKLNLIRPYLYIKPEK